MTIGQETALQSLNDIQNQDPYVFEIINVQFPEELGKPLVVEISLYCGSLKNCNGGLPLREREKFYVYVPSDFPFEKPEVWVNHKRFKGWPHVQWGQYLCLYQSPNTEWDVSDGIFGFIQRLWIWIEHGAKNQLNPIDLPIHPPITYRSNKSSLLIVPKSNTPSFKSDYWVGFAEVKAITKNRYDVAGWVDFESIKKSTNPIVPSILINDMMTWEMPKELESLINEIEIFGIKKSGLLHLLAFSIALNQEDFPLFVIIGTRQRGVVSQSQLQQHIMAWEADPTMIKALRLSLNKYSDDIKLKNIGEDAERIANEYTKLIDVYWCRVLENRPEVTVRRDINTPVEIFRNKIVCIWGCGALGSHVACYLAKAGVKKLILIDNDIVTPGIIVRQLFNDVDVGHSKVESLKYNLNKTFPELEVEAVKQDLLEIIDLTNGYKYKSDYIIDCSASDAVHSKYELFINNIKQERIPIISMLIGRKAERGIVTFIKSSHSGGIKDIYRKAKITACSNKKLSSFVEDFYPLENTEIFQPEPGCSDATFVGSEVDISVLSGSMINLISKELLNPKSDLSAMCYFVSQPPVEYIIKKDEWKADFNLNNVYSIRISPDALEKLMYWVKKSKKRLFRTYETGGVLFGKIDETMQVVWVDDVTGPPSDSKSSHSEFICGVKDVQKTNDRLYQQTRGTVSFIGMWHTHPDGFPIPSHKDHRGMIKILASGINPPRKALLLIVGKENQRYKLGISLFDRSIINKNEFSVSVNISTHDVFGQKYNL